MDNPWDLSTQPGLAVVKTLIACLSLAALALPPVHAEDYPGKPIRLLVPYSPGGPVDIVDRITAQKLSDALGQQVVVDNRAGGGGNIAVEIVARSAPDGYTLLTGANGTNAINPSLYPKLPVDPARDLAPISMVASSPMPEVPTVSEANAGYEVSTWYGVFAPVKTPLLGPRGRIRATH